MDSALAVFTVPGVEYCDLRDSHIPGVASDQGKVVLHGRSDKKAVNYREWGLRGECLRRNPAPAISDRLILVQQSAVLARSAPAQNLPGPESIRVI